MRFLLAVLALAVPGCGLTLDYDPPTDAGGPGLDGARLDAPPSACTSDVDCDDGNPCTGIEQCIDGACSPGVAVDCSNEDRCDGEEQCDPGTGECQPGPPLSCDDDGDACNGPELCDPVEGCAHGAPLSCDDGVACTVDDCDPDVGCTFEPDDELCRAATGGRCDEELGCIYDECNDTWCNDAIPCRPAHCEGNTCVREDVVCGAEEECCAGECVPVGCDDDNECTADECLPRIGCTSTATVGPCDDGIECTGAGFCRDGSCRRGGDVCSDPVPLCHVSMCTVAGTCTAVPTSGDRCDDGNVCTVAEQCESGRCVPSGSVVCDDFDSCTDDTCDALAGCQYARRPDGSSCSIGITPGTCRGGVCGELTLCPATSADCDGDGECECLGRCAPGAAGALRCVLSSLDCLLLGCLPGQTCCGDPLSPTSGTCFSDGCSTCCISSGA